MLKLQYPIHNLMALQLDSTWFITTKTALPDVAIASPLTQRLLRKGASARVPGPAATALSALKKGTYSGLPVTPFLVETYGRVNDSALTRVRQHAPEKPSERSETIRAF